MPLTNAQLRAEIDRLDEVMADRSKVPNNLSKFTGKRGEDVREWLFQIENACRINGIQVEGASARLSGIAGSAMEKPASSTTRSEEDTWENFREHVPQHFESSNYQAALREKLLQFKQTADIETYNGEYSALIFRVEGMSELDQVLNYANGLKPRTRAYVKLENPATLSAAMDLAVKYAVIHFVDEARVCQDRFDKNKIRLARTPRNPGKPFRGKGCFKDKTIETKVKNGETRTCFHFKKPGHIRADCFAWKKLHARKRQITSVNEGPAVVKSVTRALKVDNVSINVLCENPLVYKSSPLFSIHGEISAGGEHITSSTRLPDTGATTIYVSKTWVEKNKLTTTRFQEKNIRVKLGDNQIVEADLELIALTIKVPAVDEAYKCVAVIYAIPDQFDCILGVPFFEDIQPLIDWSGRRIKGTKKTFRAERTSETIGPIQGGGPAIASGSRRSAGAKGVSSKRSDSGRGAPLETDVKPVVEVACETAQSGTPRVACEQQDFEPIGRGSTAGSNKRSSSDKGATESRAGEKINAVEKMFTMGVVDAAGVETKKFLRIKTKNQDAPDFVMVLSNETIKRVASALQRRDQPDNGEPCLRSTEGVQGHRVSSRSPEGLPEKREIEHRIDVRDLNLAMYRHQWRQSPEQQREIVHWVKAMVKKKLIRPSISPHAAPTFCVRKPVGWRIVHDYRYLNSNTIHQSIRMTRKEYILDDMDGEYYYSAMDLMSAYYQVRMRVEDIKFTAFQDPNGLWEYLVLPMGVCNAPAITHRLTSKLFRGLKQTRSFYDDIYIFTKSQDINKHLEALRKTLDILRDNKLYVKLSKCVFCAPEIPCLGDFVDRDGVSMDPDKLQTIIDWPELHSFLGLTGYVQRFCPEYASLTATMFTILMKQNKRNAKIRFDKEQLKNFKELKRRLCGPPVLHLPNFNQPIHLRTDASKFAVGGVLIQVVDGVAAQSPELNYPTQQQELLAIAHALAAFRIYCLDKSPIVETDHKSLEELFTQMMANRRLARWYDMLAEYQPIISYLPGTKNGIADALSRRSDLPPETKYFHELSVTSCDDTSFTMEISAVMVYSDLIKKIKAAYIKVREIQAIFAAIMRRTVNLKPKAERQHRKKYRGFTESNGLLWYQTPADDVPRVVVPYYVKLRYAIISECHDSNYGGHPGAERTYLTLVRRWYWSKMLASIQKFIADCEPCRRNKPRLTKPPGLLVSLSIPDERWRSISMAFITDLPQTKNEVDSMWFVVDRLTKRCHFIQTTKKEGVAQRFVNHMWKLHRMPTNIVSDRDRKFVSNFWQNVFKSIGTKLSMTVALRDQGNDQTERMNRMLEEYLRCFVGPLQDDWDDHLANAEFAVNSTVNSSMKIAPFEADLGYIPLNPLQLAAEQLSKIPASRQVVEFHERQASILLRCREALARAQDRMKDGYDHNRKQQEFRVGDQVYLSTQNLESKHTGLPALSKFGPKWIDPYSIVRNIHNHAYELNIQSGNKLHPVFNTGSLKPY
ncbi:LOW QUALITY PROTEIN: Pol Polyprotein [Phytophthora megakarya]|uniref:RNA-directed DNA polymerase n=1 Tax=Phytophthora megakarya TaxID=4795 RepID=A0A225WH89_9STRA|nr:LOW QUALITY PROTEIN: Pol Polyprotein [Phytophthora megakarya]